MKTLRLLLLVAVATALSVGFGSVARAQSEPDTIQYKKKTVIDFNDVTLEGELTKPEGAYVLNRKRTKFSSLIKLRGDFLRELQTSVDNL
ncbi:MAG: hypothetical protein D6729_03140 [Deltaproteobacteria bacterium]|nr:MAG: hypothetical protein D6729_03140 [Deltaproteobacteria bacterium]